MKNGLVCQEDLGHKTWGAVSVMMEGEYCDLLRASFKELLEAPPCGAARRHQMRGYCSFSWHFLYFCFRA